MSGPSSIHPDDEERVATDMSRAIEALASESGIRPPVDFADRVMAAIATEPLPQPVRAFGVALLAGRLRAAAASVGDAWRVVGGGSTPLAVRVQALALVLALTVVSLAVAGGATVGAIGLLTTSPPPAPITTPSPNTAVPSDPAPSPSPSPSIGPDGSPDASPAAEPTETPEATEAPAGPRSTDGPRTSTPRPAETDDHGGGTGGDGSGGEDPENSGPGSGSGSDDDHTPSPTETDGHSTDD